MTSSTSTEMNLACPACGETQRESVLSVDRVPTSCAQLFATLERAVKAPDCRLDIQLCCDCGHIWNAAHKDEAHALYNDDYYSSVTESPQGRDYQDALAKDLDRILGLRSKTVIEIGCGDGYFLETLSSHQAKGIGFEPSATFQVANDRPGIQVRNEMFQFDSPGNSEFESDLVVMRHVLEHIPSAKDMLQSLSHQKFKGKVPSNLFIEVPNAMHALTNNLYFDFYNDHVHYFSAASLTRMAARAGWRPLEKITGTEEFLRLVFSNDSQNAAAPAAVEDNDQFLAEVSSSAAVFRESFTKWSKDLNHILKGLKENGGRIAVWGAGARGLSLLAGLNLPGGFFEYVIDSDTGKHGRFLPAVHLPVYPQEHLETAPVDCVMVTSYTYFNEIWTQLADFRARGGKVLKVYPEAQLAD